MIVSQAQRSQSASAQPAADVIIPPVLICSIPKAGTYLLSDVVEKLGSRKTHFHISQKQYSDYSFGSSAEHRKNPEKFRVIAEYQDVLSSLRPGTHAVSHLPCEEESQAVCLRNAIKVLFLARDLRDCAISYMRFLADTGRDNSAQSEWIQAEDGPLRLIRFLETYHWFFSVARAIISWQFCPMATTIHYERLMGDYGSFAQYQTVEQICLYLGLNAEQFDMKALFASVLNKPTLTWSGRRTQRSIYWSDAAEQRFKELGGNILNHSLGYE